MGNLALVQQIKTIGTKTLLARALMIAGFAGVLSPLVLHDRPKEAALAFMAGAAVAGAGVAVERPNDARKHALTLKEGLYCAASYVPPLLKIGAYTIYRPVVFGCLGMGAALYPIATKAAPVPFLLMSGTGFAMVGTAYQRSLKEEAQQEFEERLLERQRDAALEAQSMGHADEAYVQYLERSLAAYQALPEWMRPSHLKPQKGSSDDSIPKLGGMDWGKWLDKAGGSETVDVSAHEVGQNGSAGQNPGTGATGFEVMDLAQKSARLNRSLLLSAPSGVGKTNFIRWFLHATNEEYEGGAIYQLIDFKGITGHYCGLEKTRNYIKSGASGRNYQEAQEVIQSTIELLDSYQSDGVPYYFIADEINNGLRQAEGSGRNGRQAKEDLKRKLGFIVTQGRERDIRGVLTSHSNVLEAIGLDSNEAQSLIFAVLGRHLPEEQGDGFALIRRLLDSTQATLFSSEERAALKAKFEQLRTTVEQTGQAITLTNISGRWEFYYLPEHYANDPGMLDLGFQNQSIEQQVREVSSVAKKARSTEFDPSRLPVLGSEFIQYLLKKVGDGRVFKVRELYKNWAGNQLNSDGSKTFPATDDFREFLAKVGMAGAGHFVDTNYWEWELTLTSLESDP